MFAGGYLHQTHANALWDCARNASNPSLSRCYCLSTGRRRNSCMDCDVWITGRAVESARSKTRNRRLFRVLRVHEHVERILHHTPGQTAHSHALHDQEIVVITATSRTTTDLPHVYTSFPFCWMNFPGCTHVYACACPCTHPCMQETHHDCCALATRRGGGASVGSLCTTFKVNCRLRSQACTRDFT